MGQINDLGSGAVAALERIATDLADLIAETAAGADLILVSPAAQAPYLVKDFPFDGARRGLVRRESNGPANTIVTVAGVLLYDADVNRLGGILRNTDAVNGITLWLAERAQGARGSVWLAPNGSWDFKLGELLWGGAVFAVAAAGTPAVTGAVI